MNMEPITATAATALAAYKIFEASLRGAEAALSRVCGPALEEFGFLLRDKVQFYRACNFISTMSKFEQIMTAKGQANPRIVHSIVEQASWTDDAVVQDLWAGLLASSCTEEGNDDSNLIFVNLLSALTKLQARVLRYACENSGKVVHGGLILAEPTFIIDFSELCEIAEDNDRQRLDRELDHLRSLQLLQPESPEGWPGGLSADDPEMANVTPSSLALHMYVRCCGSRQSPIEFFNLVLSQPVTHPSSKDGP